MRTLLPLLVALLASTHPLAAQEATPGGRSASVVLAGSGPAFPAWSAPRVGGGTATTAAPGPLSLRPHAALDSPAHTLRRRRLSVVGGVVGFLFGGVIGGAIGCLANQDAYGIFCGGQNDTRVFLAAGIGAVGGAALGALVLGRGP